MSRADAMIYGAPRSGTTVLMSLMSTPGKTWCIGEPWNEDAGVVRNAPQRHAKAYGLDLSQCTSLEQVADDVEGLKLERWGAKEVFFEDFGRTVKVFDPNVMIFMVRDPRDACLSYKNCLKGHPWNHKGINAPERTGDDEYLVKVFADHCRGVVGVYGGCRMTGVPLRVVHYEDLLDPLKREALARDLDWPFNGTADRFGRREELRGGVFTREVDADERIFELVEKEMGDFMEVFGYKKRAIA